MILFGALFLKYLLREDRALGVLTGSGLLGVGRLRPEDDEASSICESEKGSRYNFSDFFKRILPSSDILKVGRPHRFLY